MRKSVRKWTIIWKKSLKQRLLYNSGSAINPVKSLRFWDPLQVLLDTRLIFISFLTVLIACWASKLWRLRERSISHQYSETVQRSFQPVFDSISNSLPGENIHNHCWGDILSIDYMLLGSIQTFSDEEISSTSKDASMWLTHCLYDHCHVAPLYNHWWDVYTCAHKADIHTNRPVDKIISHSDQRLILIMIIRNTRHCLLFWQQWVKAHWSESKLYLLC